MIAALTILQNTPLWVFAVFALLLWLGIAAIRPRVVGLRRLLATPGIFIVWGLITLAQRSTADSRFALEWLALAAIAGALTFATLRLSGLGVDRSRGLVHLPGTILPLARNLLIFAAKYAIAVLIARRPDLQAQLLWWDVGISGAAAGYFFGWLARFFLTYRSARELGQALSA